MALWDPPHQPCRRTSGRHHHSFHRRCRPPCSPSCPSKVIGNGAIQGLPILRVPAIPGRMSKEGWELLSVVAYPELGNGFAQWKEYYFKRLVSSLRGLWQALCHKRIPFEERIDPASQCWQQEAPVCSLITCRKFWAW